MNKYFNQDVKTILSELNVDANSGLSEDEAKRRLEEYGENALRKKKSKPKIVKFLEEFNDVLIIILIIAATISIIVDKSEWIESLIIYIVVILNAIMGFTQENKAEKSLEALKKLSSPHAKVKREGKIYQIEASKLVPGDIICIEAGDYVPADARLIEVSKLKIDESALTGESVPTNKQVEMIDKDNVGIGDKKNMIFTSTFISYGRGVAVVVSTGMNTEIGHIASMLQETKIELTPLQIKLNQIAKSIGLIAIIVCVIVFLLEWLGVGSDILDSFKSSIALAVAAIPEGLATVVTIVLAIGVDKMAKEKAIVKRLPAVETLGCTSVICTDKTGTLTVNRMTVVKICKDEIKDCNEFITTDEKEMLTYFAVCSDASIDNKDGKIVSVGDPTEIALVDANIKYGKTAKEEIIRYKDLSFDSDRKMMSVIVDYQGKILCITKGAPDVVISRSKNCDKERILSNNSLMGNNALRVLAVAIKELDVVPEDEDLESEKLEKDLTFIGLVGMIDPSRPEVKDAIAIAKQAGIRTIMVTGDHIITAKAIAKDLGILNEGEEAISSIDLQKISDEELFENIEKYSVYARVAPEDKVRIVNAWQAKDKVVAMTGDGVNDSPALKTADIGCAMGITGTDVSKEAASMILVDDNFATIVSAVKKGRGLYDNIKKAVRYLLSSNIGEIITIFLASLLSTFTTLSLGIPLLPMHLLWVNLITDSLPAFSLGLEEPSKDIMKKKPRDKKEGFFANKLGIDILWQGVLIGLITLFAYIIGHTQSPESYLGQTMAFVTLSTIQLMHSFNVKSDKTIFSKQTFNNKYLILSALVGFVLQILIVYIPFLANIFKLDNTLSFINLILCLGLSSLIIVACEIKKFIIKKK